MNRPETRRAMRDAGYRGAPGKRGRRAANRPGVEARRVAAADIPATAEAMKALEAAGFVVARPKLAIPH